MMRAVGSLLILLCISGCAGGIGRGYQFSASENQSLLLLDSPLVLPLPADFATAHHLQQPIWGANRVHIVRVDQTGPVGPETTVLLTADGLLQTSNRALMLVPGYLHFMPSVFAPVRLQPGKYAVTRVEGQLPSSGVGFVDVITYCPLSNAPVFEVRAGEVDVLDIAEILGIADAQNLWGRNGHWSSSDRARELLQEFPDVSAPVTAIHISGRTVLPHLHENLWATNNCD